jgi:multidrug efflux pump
MQRGRSQAQPRWRDKRESPRMSKFFIERPAFAWVIALFLMLAGLLAIKILPISQYPSIAPPQISITVTYPGASAQTVQDTVVQVIEQQMNGLDGLEYLSSQSNSDGSMEIDLTFRQGTNPDIAQVQVQNKLQLATPLLPAEVQQQGIRVAKATKNFLVVLSVISADGSMNKDDLTDYIAANLQDPISRTPGVGDFQLFGSQYAMRIWLDPARLNNYGLTISDVTAAIQKQNVQIATGRLGGHPSVAGQQLTATIVGPSRLQTSEEFGQILLKVNSDGSQVRLNDVGRSELGSESYDTNVLYNGQPAGGLAVKLASGANALDTIKAVDATIDGLKPFFPPGLEVIHAYDTTPFVRISIREVVETLGEAIVLVFLVMFLFLQNFRATLIPTIAVPVVLLGTFAVLSAAGYSINTLTMFGMVLAIGLLIDDAIVVVENVERVMAEEGLSPKEATKKSMGQITGALVGIALVLSAVFLPMAFFGGSTGVIYRQFAITIVSAMVLSVLVALILTPALCATMLKPVTKGGDIEKRGFFGWFNRNFNRSNRGYVTGVHGVLGRPARFLVVYVGVVVVIGLLFTRLPTAFLPEEDQGILGAQVTTPPGATNVRTDAVLKQVADYLLTEEKDSVESVTSISGFGFNGRGENAGIALVKLKDWSQRSASARKVPAIIARVTKHFAGIKDALVFVFAPPAVVELGNANGFDLELQDRAGIGHDRLMAARNQFLGMGAQSPILTAVRPNGLEDAPQYKIQIDREKLSALGLTIGDVDDTLSTAWGSSYVNDFIDRGRVKKVFVQGEAPSRMNPDDLNKWYVRNASGGMVPFSAFASAKWTYGPEKLERYNGVPSLEVLGNPAPGQSTGAAMATAEELASKLPPGVGYEWTGLSYEERLAGPQAPALYAISLIVVFLSLVALYESWAIPASVMMVIPLGVVGTIAATWLRGLSNDVYFQVGLLTTVGLSAKNAILIIAFAKDHFDHGGSLVDSAIQAARQRLRPILMTSLAFILGVLPLAITSGAGSGAQNAIGTGVIGGMLTATFLAIFLVPLFFVVILRLFRVKPRQIDDTVPESVEEIPSTKS